MKERPILMSTPMVQAILRDEKTQTRRIIKPQLIRDDYWNGGYKYQRKKRTVALNAINN